MRLALQASAATALPLFGPVRESEWAAGWSPTFVVPVPPAQGPDGAVFTTEGHGGVRSVWVMTNYDTTAGHVAYVVVTPGVVTCELDIRVAADGPDTCHADVTYRYTALGADGEAFIHHWLERFPAMPAHWEHALNARLTGAPHAAR